MKNTFKKITSVILAMFILMSVSVTAFATPGSGEYVGGSVYQSGLVAREIYERYEASHPLAQASGTTETPLWDYDNHYRYTEENGTVWRYFNGRNYIVCQEDERWLYQILEDGTLMIGTSADIEWSGELEVVVPSVLDGKTVTILEYWASRTGAISVIVPDTVTELGYDCFRGAEIKRVYLPSSVKRINSEAFDLNNYNVELYYGGSEEEMKNITVYHVYNGSDLSDWSVTGYDWLAKPFTDDTTGMGRNYTTEIKAVYYNADPNNLPPIEDLIEDEEPVEPTFWEKVAQAFENFADSIVVFFEKVANFFANLFA